MKIDLIIIGNELLNGKIQDLNTQFLAKEIFKYGHEFRQVQIIADNYEQFTHALKNSLEKADIIFTTGGLGPTKDDLTKKMLSDYFHKEVEYNQAAFEITKKQYDRGNRVYDQEKIDYHNLPLDFKPIYNPIGFAPGIEVVENEKKIFSLPGVPSEFQSMLTQEILPKIELSKTLTKHVIVKTWKIPESKIFTKLAPKLWEDLEKLGEVSSLPHLLGVDIGVKISGFDLNEIQQKEKQILEIIYSTPIKENIWHIGPESIEEVIIKIAKKKKIKIGFAESCTGGLCASRMTDISGSSSVFWGSIISYANEVKSKTLRVSEATLKDHGAVSIETAKNMAKGACHELGVDIVISTSGIAGPTGGSIEKPVGTVAIGVHVRGKTEAQLYQFHGNRKSLKHKFSEKALMILLEELIELKS